MLCEGKGKVHIMTQFFNQKVALMGNIQRYNHIGMPPMQNLEALDKVQTESFKDTLGNMAAGLNKQMNEPERMINGIMSGNTDIDMHDVMTAMAKAEMSVSVATQITSKVIQAYDKIMQISV